MTNTSSQAGVTPFRIDIPQSTLDDLQTRLKLTRWPDDAADARWDSGTNPAYLRELVEYWQTGYDWRKQEAALNQLPQFKTTIDGIEIHFVHVRGSSSANMPILLAHGFPDSFYRFHKVVPMLAHPEQFGGSADDGMDVIVPSMPGYGFSAHQAMTDTAIADLWAKLMQTLGYAQFTAAGGDLGTGVVKSLARSYPQSVSAIYLTDVGFPNGTEDFATFSPAEREFAGKCQQWWYTEAAYNMLQSSKPRTLAAGLNDSPVGLAAWIIEKFHAWSGGSLDGFSKDELLTNIMIYWLSGTIHSAVRMYLENARAIYMTGEGPKPETRVDVPAGVASFPGEAVPLPREWAERMVNLKRFTEMPKGGHFSALEVPELYARDVLAFLREVKIPA